MSHILRYYALITSKNCTIFKYECDFGSKIELCHCELRVTLRKKDFRDLDRTVTIMRGRLGAGRLGAGRLGAGHLCAADYAPGLLCAWTFRRRDF